MQSVAVAYDMMEGRLTTEGFNQNTSLKQFEIL